MAAEKPSNTDGFLAMIEAKIAALQALAASYRAAVSVGALGAGGEIDLSGLASSPAASGTPIELPKGALLGKSIPAAIKLFLSAARQKQTTREITNALKEGGVESTSANFENIVTSSLNRMRAAGDVLRFSDGWALAEFYPENLRNRLAAQAEGKKPAPSKTRKRTPKKKSAKLQVVPAPEEKTEAVG